jgi:hypothetical protein
VRPILTNVLQELLADPSKTFNWAEVYVSFDIKSNSNAPTYPSNRAFFKLWWEEQSVEIQEQFKNLVRKGQIEFVGGMTSVCGCSVTLQCTSGGVVQNDEAVAHLDGIVNQVTEGHDYIWRHFGVKPKIAWQVSAEWFVQTEIRTRCA